jgi:hypothetical protein
LRAVEKREKLTETKDFTQYNMFEPSRNKEVEVLPKELTQETARRGKWTLEEEKYAERIIHDFENGTLDVQDGTTLRNYLSKTLNCDPMRITKKFTGDSCIGKRVFATLSRSPENIPILEKAQIELKMLRRLWLEKLLGIERESARKICIKGTLKDVGRPRFTGNADDLMSVADSGNICEDKVRAALHSFLDNEKEINELMSWLSRSSNALTFSSDYTELDSLAKCGEKLVTSVHKHIIDSNRIHGRHGARHGGHSSVDGESVSNDEYEEEDEEEDSAIGTGELGKTAFKLISPTRFISIKFVLTP